MSRLYVFAMMLRGQIAKLQGDVADLTKQLHTANAGATSHLTCDVLFPYVWQSDRERAEAVAAASQAREAKSHEKMVSAKSDKAQLKVQRAHDHTSALHHITHNSCQHIHQLSSCRDFPRSPCSCISKPSKSACAATCQQMVRMAR